MVHRTDLSHLLNEIFTKIIYCFLQKSSKKKVPREPPRIEKLKFVNKISLCFLSATFLQKKKMRFRFWRISRSTDEIEQYGKQSSLCFLLLFFFVFVFFFFAFFFVLFFFVCFFLLLFFFLLFFFCYFSTKQYANFVNSSIYRWDRTVR